MTKDRPFLLDGHCVVCGQEIKIMIFKGTPFCSVNCQKKFYGEIPVPSSPEASQ